MFEIEPFPVRCFREASDAHDLRAPDWKRTACSRSSPRSWNMGEPASEAGTSILRTEWVHLKPVTVASPHPLHGRPWLTSRTVLQDFRDEYTTTARPPAAATATARAP